MFIPATSRRFPFEAASARSTPAPWANSAAEAAVAPDSSSSLRVNPLFPAPEPSMSAAYFRTLQVREEGAPEEVFVLEGDFDASLQVPGFAAGVDVAVLAALWVHFFPIFSEPEIGCPAPPAILGILALVR